MKKLKKFFLCIYNNIHITSPFTYNCKYLLKIKKNKTKT